MNYTYVPLPLVEEAQSVSASAQVLVIDDGEVKRTDASNIGIIPTGKISISENGTDIDISAYATADVAVSGGSSNFSTAEVTVTINGDRPLPLEFYGTFIINDELVSFTEVSETGTLTVVLYKGTNQAVSVSPDENDSITVTGGIVYDDGPMVITGDGTLTDNYGDINPK